MKDRKITWKVWVGISVISVLAGIGWFQIKHHRNKGAFKEIKVVRGDLKVTILSTGTVQPQNRLEIKPPIAGRVEKILVDEGVIVKKGQILAWMSSTERAALLDAARSKGNEELKSWEDLYKPTPVLAPITGTIIARNVESGQTFGATDAILVMSDRLIVKAQVDETDIAQIKLKQKAEVVLDAYPNNKQEATVDQIAYDAKTVNSVTVYLVDVLPKEIPPYMRSGMTANVSFLQDFKSGILLLPTEAIKSRGGKNFVLEKGPKGKMQEREITVGISDGKTTEVVSGAQEQESVFVPVIKVDGKKPSSSPFNPMGAGTRGGGRGGR